MKRDIQVLRSRQRGRRWGAVAIASTLILSACNGGENDTDEDTAAADPDEDTSGEDQASGGEQSEAEGAQQAGGEMTISAIEDADNLDPTYGQTFGGRYIFANMCEKLYDITPDLELVPQLASELPEFSDDALTATIRLREGVVFNDGEPFNAEAVKTSLDRHREAEASARAGELTPITDVSVVDDLTVELTMDEPFAPLTAVLADRSGMIMSPAKLAELGDDFTQDPVCVGPFQFVERIVGDRIVLERAPDYYDADQVFLDRVIFTPISDSAVQTANLRSGEVQLVDRLSTVDVASIENEDGLTVDEVTSIGHDSIITNLQQAPFDDPLVRQAFQLAIDRGQLVMTAVDGLATPSCQPWSPASAFNLDDWECPEQDVGAAQDLLAEAGVNTPVEVDFLTPNNSVAVRQGEVLQELVREAGFQLNLRPIEIAAFANDAVAGNFDALLNSWSGRVDPDGNVYVFQHTDGGQNYGAQSDPELDSLLEQGRTEVDEGIRQDIYREVWATASDNAYQFILAHQNLYFGRSEAVTGFQAYPDGMPRMKGVSLSNG